MYVCIYIHIDLRPCTGAARGDGRAQGRARRGARDSRRGRLGRCAPGPKPQPTNPSTQALFPDYC